MSNMTDSELLRIVIGSNTRACSSQELSKKALEYCGGNIANIAQLSANELHKLVGISKSKSASIYAAFELGRRVALRKPVATKIMSSRDAYTCLYDVLSNIPHEEFWILVLMRNNAVLARHKISEGGVASTHVDIKKIFQRVLLHDRATSVILFHNHPSGNLTPSESDLALTKNIVNSGKVLEINVLDHIIIGNGDYYSLADNGCM